MITITLKIKDVGCPKHGPTCRHVDVVARARAGRRPATQKERFTSWLLRRAIDRAVREYRTLKDSSAEHEYYMRNGGEMISSE